MAGQAASGRKKFRRGALRNGQCFRDGFASAAVWLRGSVNSEAGFDGESPNSGRIAGS